MWRDPHPKPCYLFALVGGDLASYASDFTTASGRKVDLRIYVEPGKEGRCAWAMDSLKRSMRWDEERFGREYDLGVFNIVAVSDFNMGAMENKGLNIFNDALILASPETATDASFAAIERVIAHEYFHNWTGNRITCRDWFQLCLKEGLTVFRDQEFCADQRFATVAAHRDVRSLKAAQFPEDAGPLAHPVRPNRYIEINNFYTATVYKKGAEVVRMLQTLLGRDGFRKGMDLYFERHDGEAATVEDFLDLLRGRHRQRPQAVHDVVCAGRHAGARVRAELRCAHASTAELTIEQVLPPTPGEPKKKPLHIPLRLGLLGSDGRDLRSDAGVGRADRRRSRRTHASGPRSSGSATCLRGRCRRCCGGSRRRSNLTIDLADADLQLPDGHDSDLFNRWQAAQDYATRVLVAAVTARTRAANGQTEPTEFVERAGRDARRRETRAGLSRPVHDPAERERPRPHHRPRRGPAGHPPCAADLRKAIGVALHEAWPRIYRRSRGQGSLFACPRSRGQARLAQRGPRLHDVPRTGGRHGARGGPFHAMPATPPTR